MEKDPSRFSIDRTYKLSEDLSEDPSGQQAEANEPGYSFALYKGFISQGENVRLKARHFLEKVFASHPLVAPILRHDPPFFRAAHAPFCDREL